MSEHLLTELKFSDIDLPPEVQKGLDDAGFEYCTSIQEKALPLTRAGRDVAGQAQTGTGKTAAFLVALFSTLLRDPPSDNRRPSQPLAIVIAPTRELAIQIYNDATTLGSHTGLSIGVVYGGEGYVSQRERLAAGIDVLIGTPGRIIDYFKQRVFDLKAIRVMVLDEADRMFDLGFIRDIRYLMRRMPLPEKRLSMLFSATLSYRVMELAYEHMNNPEMVRIEPDQVTTARVRQAIYYPSNDEKIPLLIGLLKQHDPKRTMVFVNTKRTAERVTAYLEENGYKTALLSGDVPQRKRLALLKGFTTGEFPLLVATDVASRGLHIPEVSHIVNFDLPQSEEDYVHRIGRTARAGADGDAISFACEEYAFHLPEIEAYIGYKIPAESVSPDLLAEARVPPRRRHPKRTGRRDSTPPGRRRSSGNRRRRPEDTPVGSH
ncbi:MAG: ATP-dependent RNA helicase RhlB [Gammaproteobacteria bacterium]|jgi:ATP-dependent RNA helicase RhlB|nr:ATP-dependent RNA helicase RhlB [Gammaproteobacteria bacterium]